MSVIKKVHIALVGKDINNVIAGIVQRNADEFYPIISASFRPGTGENDSLKKIRKKVQELEEMSGKKIVIPDPTELKDAVINPFKMGSYENIVDSIIKIINERKNKCAIINAEIERKKKTRIETDEEEEVLEFYINVTGGTNLMSAAAFSAAVLTKSNGYYVLKRDKEKDWEGGIIDLPVHSFDMKPLETRQRKILAIVKENDGSNDKKIFNELEKKDKRNLTLKMIRYSLEKLERQGYIERIQDGRSKKSKLTHWGNMKIKILGI